MMSHQNQYNNNKNKKQNNESTSQPFRLLTHNVRGLSLPSKQAQIENFFTNSNLAVMGLAETKLTNKAAQHMFRSTNFRFFYNNNSTSPLSQGVGLLIDNNYAKFIQKSGGFKGRILYVDMFLKGRIKLRIIQVYLHANFHSEFKEDIEATHNFLIRLIEESQWQSQHIIVMGDFNVNPTKYQMEYNQTGRFHWKYKILHELFTHNMIDTVNLLHDIDVNNPYYTFFPGQNNFSPSRLDMIYVSHDLMEHVLQSNNYHVTEYSSDHHAVHVAFDPQDIFSKQSIAQLK